MDSSFQPAGYNWFLQRMEDGSLALVKDGQPYGPDEIVRDALAESIFEEEAALWRAWEYANDYRVMKHLFDPPPMILEFIGGRHTITSSTALASVTISLVREDGTTLTGSYHPHERCIEDLCAAASINSGSREGYIQNLLCDAFHAGMDAITLTAFKRIWRGYGPHRETIYERNVEAPDNSPGYAFYDTPEGRVWMTRAELLPHLDKLRA
jgi:hypothetical protein